MSKNHRKPLSRYFPSYHPKSGDSTYFIEKIWSGLDKLGMNNEDLTIQAIRLGNFREFIPKWHTIRNIGKCPIKIGDTIQFYIWSGRPYWSKQIIVTPKIPIKKVYDIEIEPENRRVQVGGEEGLWWQYNLGNIICEIAKNDGLSITEFWNWFSNPFKGQIICWNSEIEY